MSRVRAVIVLVAGAVLGVAGAVLALTRHAVTGWVAYAPLSASGYRPPDPAGPPLAFDVVLIAVGAFAAGGAAVTLGRRRAP